MGESCARRKVEKLVGGLIRFVIWDIFVGGGFEEERVVRCAVGSLLR